MKKLRLLQAAVFVLLSSGVLMAAGPASDPCAAIKAELSILTRKSSDLSDQFERTRDELEKTRLKNQIAALLKQIQAKMKERDQCIANTPPPPPRPGSFEIDEGNDFQVAVGRRNLVAVTSSDIYFYKKAATPTQLQHWDASEFFKKLWNGSNENKVTGNINFHLGLPRSSTFGCDPNSPDIPKKFLARSPEDRPKHLDEINSCVNEYYDTRVIYDDQRQRFWIESAGRNHIWTCTHDLLQYSGLRTNPEWDPDPTQKTGAMCHRDSDWKGSALRYIAIAVSK